MECERYREGKVLWLYGETGPEAEALQEHIEACPSCREDLQELDEVLLVYRESAGEGMPRAVRERLVRRQAGRPRWFSHVAAAISGAVLIGFLAGPPVDAPEAVSWNEIDFAGIGLVLHLTPRELAEVRRAAEAPEAWEPGSFGGEGLEDVRCRLAVLSGADFW